MIQFPIPVKSNTIIYHGIHIDEHSKGTRALPTKGVNHFLETASMEMTDTNVQLPFNQKRKFKRNKKHKGPELNSTFEAHESSIETLDKDSHAIFPSPKSLYTRDGLSTEEAFEETISSSEEDMKRLLESFSMKIHKFRPNKLDNWESTYNPNTISPETNW